MHQEGDIIQVNSSNYIVLGISKETDFSSSNIMYAIYPDT